MKRCTCTLTENASAQHLIHSAKDCTAMKDLGCVRNFKQCCKVLKRAVELPWLAHHWCDFRFLAFAHALHVKIIFLFCHKIDCFVLLKEFESFHAKIICVISLHAIWH